MLREIYVGIEDLALTAGQRGLLVTALRTLGPGNDPSPARLCHWSTRPDGKAAIFQALFDEDHVSIDAFKSYLGNVFGVSPALIGSSSFQVVFAGLSTSVVTFSYQSVNKLRVVVFGYDGRPASEYWPTLEESRMVSLAYLNENKSAWFTEN